MTDLRIAVFSVPRRVVVIKRGTGIALGAYGLVMIALFYPWHDPLPPESIAHIVWPMLAVSIAALLAFVWRQWKRIPPGAPGGTLQIGPSGIDYRVGPDQVHLGWSQIAGVTPIAKPSRRQVSAIWLPNEDPAPPSSSRMTLLQIAHAKSPYRPVERPDGVLLPIGLFGQAAAGAIVHALGTHLEGQGQRS
ncbi:hypothetical protein [Paragemmobacter ruber]|uniref:PH domain-containing protein n=1 Tax=Paragemmobacter ruber TaxID=1985673 RepID=A0ABW9Y641_9RHOB|nr:hypothetical protein [Rhodobacter ruber]NBE07357.1 hypothetical protein [Rhodobacter ruber]